MLHFLVVYKSFQTQKQPSCPQPSNFLTVLVLITFYGVNPYHFLKIRDPNHFFTAPAPIPVMEINAS